jgi:rRNA maturation endonuclease Nob1
MNSINKIKFYLSKLEDTIKNNQKYKLKCYNRVYYKTYYNDNIYTCLYCGKDVHTMNKSKHNKTKKHKEHVLFFDNLF